jgi:hypothetical protein
LSFWHGVLCIFPELDQAAVLDSSNLLVGLVRRYELGYADLGQLVASVAAGKVSDEWGQTFVRMVRSAHEGQTSGIEDMIRAFSRVADQVPVRSNLRARFPLHASMAIPCLLWLLLNRPGVTHVGGGMLSESAAQKYSHVSVPTSLPPFEQFDLPDLSPSKFAVDPGAVPARPLSAAFEASAIDEGSFARRRPIWLCLALLVLLTGGMMMYRGGQQSAALQQQLKEAGQENAALRSEIASFCGNKDLTMVIAQNAQLRQYCGP